MTLLSAATVALLLVLLIVAAVSGALGAVVLVLLILGGVGAAWFGVGTLVSRDADHAGLDDARRIRDVIVLYGPVGLLYWYGFKRPRVLRAKETRET